MNLKELLEQETTTKPEITTKVKVCRKKNNDGVYPLKAKCEFSFYVENPDITPDNLLEVIHSHFDGIPGLDFTDAAVLLYGDKKDKGEEDAGN